MLVFSSVEDGKQFVSNINNRSKVFKSLVEDIKDALIFDLNFVTIFRYEKENMHHFLYKTDWVKSLNKALEYFEEEEEYEECIEIRDLIIILEEFYL
jgi:protein-arginine kinase activator protein McsA